MKKLEINPDTAIKYLPWVYGGIIFSMIVLPLVFHFFVLSIIYPDYKTNNPDDVPNYDTLIIETAIGILTTWTVYVYSKKWNKNNENQQLRIEGLITKIDAQQIKIVNQTNEIEKLTKNISNAFKERQLRLVSAIMSQIHFITDKCAHVNTLIDLWENETNRTKKQNRENTLIYNLNSMRNYVHQNTLSEINDVGNRKLGVAYVQLLSRCNFDSSYFDLENDFAQEFRNHFIEILNNLSIVSDELTLFINENNLKS